MNKKIITEQKLLAELRVKYTNSPPEGLYFHFYLSILSIVKYTNSPPEGITSKEVQQMSDDDLLDMDYFLNEDIFDDSDDFEEGFFIF